MATITQEAAATTTKQPALTGWREEFAPSIQSGLLLRLGFD
jgi:hypothetical protein